MAMNLVPEARFIQGDFVQYTFDERFNAIMSLYTIFHIPRNMHSAIFRKMQGWLKKNGVILVSMGTTDTPVDVQEFVGAEMAWSSFSIDDNLRLITEAGFEIMLTVDDNRNPGEHHLWILAIKKE
jgi:cyclopropane fatty-acyl-phospholipid synthase-like methyltransferase